MATTNKRTLPGRWRITSLSNLEDYLELGDKPPYLLIKASKYGGFHGEYSFGLSSGVLDGDIREFGGEKIFLFGYEGGDEMDPASGAGWARITELDRLEGEFLSYGPFTARRKRAARKRTR